MVVVGRRGRWLLGGNLRRVPNCLRTFDVVTCSMIEGFATVSYVLDVKEPLAGSGALRKRVLNPAAPASSRPQNSRKRLESMACQTKLPPNSRKNLESRERRSSGRAQSSRKSLEFREGLSLEASPEFKKKSRIQMAQGPGARENFGDKSGRDDGSPWRRAREAIDTRPTRILQLRGNISGDFFPCKFENAT